MWVFRENHHLEGKEGELGNDSVGKVINPIGPSTFILESPGEKNVYLGDFPKMKLLQEIDIKLSRLPGL